ncbi:MAG: hypothetical protein HY835_10865 [Anaerolineae bacterium]|nr:hypothetical protein [Anaerolineae bacterium]
MQKIDRFNVFTEQSQLIAQRTHELAVQFRHATIDESHVLFALLESSDEHLSRLFDLIALNVRPLKNETYTIMRRQRKVAFWKGQHYQIFVTPTIKVLIENAFSISKKFRHEEVMPVHLFAGLVEASLRNHQAGEGSDVACLLIENKINPEIVLESLEIVLAGAKNRV